MSVIDSKNAKIKKIKQIFLHNDWFGFTELHKFYGGVKYPSNGYSDKSLSLKSESQLDDILYNFDKFLKDNNEQSKKNLYYNNSAYDADFSYWCKQPYWTIDEGTTLLMGKEPRKFNYEFVSEYSSGSEFEKKYADIRETANRYVSVGELSSPIMPSLFLDWASKMNFEIPVKLLEMVATSNMYLIDWKILYSESLEIIDGLQKELEEQRLENERLTYNSQLLIDESDEFYSLELDAANITQRMVINNFDEEVSFKEQTIKCLDNTYPKLSLEAKERISIMINPTKNKAGGRRPKK